MRAPVVALLLCATGIAGWCPMLLHTAHAQTGMGGRLSAGHGEGRVLVAFNVDGAEPSAVRPPVPGESGTLPFHESPAFAGVPAWAGWTDRAWSAGMAAARPALHFAGFSTTLASAPVSDLNGAAFGGIVFNGVDGGQARLAYAVPTEFSAGWPPGGRERGLEGVVWKVRTSSNSTLELCGGLTFTYVFGEPRAMSSPSHG